jgi:O-antigen/teichoic acid export membrane protein
VKGTQVLEPVRSNRGERFFRNVLWNWSHVAFTLFSAVILSRFIIRKLGAEGYGLWQLSYSMIGYYGLLDLGFRSAVIFYSARHRALQEYDALNELITTLVVYFSVVAAVLIGISALVAGQAYRFFSVSPRYRDDFSHLVLIIGISISSGIVFNVYSGLVEGFQRFDLANQIRIVSFVIRYFGCALLLYLGYGLVAMGLIALISQLVLNVLYIVISKHIFPELRFSLRLVNWQAWKRTAAYGVHTFVASVASTSLEQSPSLVIGHLNGAAFVGYYNLPWRILQYAADAVSRVGIVVAAQAAEYTAKARMDLVAKLAIYANRYCFTLYAPLAMVVLVYRRELIGLWVGAEYVTNSAPLIPIFLAGVAFGLAGQFSSGTVLFGMGKHRGYAYALLCEAAVNVTGMLLLIPRFGLMGAAAVATSLMLAVRGVLTPWLACRQLGFPFGRYMASIFVRPVLTGIPLLLFAYWCRANLWPGNNWLQLIAVSASVASLYWGAAYFTCLEPEHKRLLWNWATARWRPQYSVA